MSALGTHLPLLVLCLQRVKIEDRQQHSATGEVIFHLRMIPLCY